MQELIKVLITPSPLKYELWIGTDTSIKWRNEDFYYQAWTLTEQSNTVKIDGRDSHWNVCT